MSCELQKMYFLPEARGKGLGTKMMQVCLNRAREFGYEKVYIETMPYMKAAQKLYQKSGFEYIDAPMGDTGHGACQVWMLERFDIVLLKEIKSIFHKELNDRYPTEEIDSFFHLLIEHYLGLARFVLAMQPPI